MTKLYYQLKEETTVSDKRFTIKNVEKKILYQYLQLELKFVDIYCTKPKKNWQLKKLNTNKFIILGANGLLIYCIILVLSVFATLYKFYLDMNNPIIPKDFLYRLNELKIIAGFFISLEILIMIILKSFKQNLLIIIMGILTMLTYYIIING